MVSKRTGTDIEVVNRIRKLPYMQECMYSPNRDQIETKCHASREDEDRVHSVLKEDMSEFPCLVSSDVHEWRND